MEPLWWIGSGAPARFYGESASEILDEQALEESIQKSVDTLFMPTENTIQWGFIPWDHRASEILNEQTEEDAQ
ncbi:hypothetical protein OG21DRAFT_1487941 [Imleria badia]|nr:hypothetical protein OG21DRAFT_1487941 [Imleria badia]